ncbi:predicted protein [Histoplasma mississippiense (nom. inval.)]|uniref:predicted protein n=1 Tax=Ajellomyces capsulatus (strain NAm1 / WU24) TaxID=2059318 RepID=UPI000157C5C3|nr:predicted protein [Histoplasma mississippiense (nom. inval.)]EDN08577.1 predicted protein [Histoplasma mississippiense (nom. inval.)]
MSDSRTPTLSAKRISWLNNEEFKRNAGRDNARGTKGYQLSRGQRREKDLKMERHRPAYLNIRTTRGHE